MHYWMGRGLYIRLSDEVKYTRDWGTVAQLEFAWALGFVKLPACRQLARGVWGHTSIPQKFMLSEADHSATLSPLGDECHSKINI